MLREAFITWHAQYLMSGKIISIIFFLIAYDNKIENNETHFSLYEILFWSPKIDSPLKAGSIE